MQHKVCSHYSSKAAQHTFSLMSDGLPRVQQQARQYTVLPRNVLQCCFHAIVIHHAFPKLKFDMKESLCWEHLVRLKKVYRMLHAWQVYPSYTPTDELYCKVYPFYLGYIQRYYTLCYSRMLCIQRDKRQRTCWNRENCKSAFSDIFICKCPWTAQ